MRPINKSKLSYKIWLTLSASFFLLYTFSSFIAYSLIQGIITKQIDENLTQVIQNVEQIVEKSTSMAIRSYLHAIAEQTTGIAAFFYKQYQSGTISKAEAQTAVRELILHQKIGASGYTYILDSHGVFKIHPKPGVVGRDVHSYKFVQTQIEKKQGFIEYEWKNPLDSTKREKVLFMDYFQPWDWIISVSAYRDELILLVEPEDFKAEILSIKIKDNDFPFIIDQQGELIAPPQLAGNVFSDRFYNADFLKELAETKEGKKFYNFTDPVDGQTRKKVILYKTIDQFGWVVAATCYVDEFYRPLIILRNMSLFLVAIGFVLASIVSYFLSKSIMSPLNNLLQNISDHSDALGLKHSEKSFENEIETIATYFGGYIKRLKDNNEHLNQLYSEQKKNSLNLSIFKEVFENIVEGISITDQDGNTILANPAFTKITGYPAEEVIGKNPNILKSNRHPPAFYEIMWLQLQEKGFWAGEIWNKRKNGEIYPEWLTISSVKGKSGEISHYVAVFDDITTSKKQQEEIQFLAYHDSLTRLPNRLFIVEQLRQLVSKVKRHGGFVICIVIDLGNFKAFNNSMGQDYGDQLLQKFVERIQTNLRLEDIFGRVGGDDFVLIFSVDLLEPKSVLTMINRLFETVEKPFNIVDHKIHLTLNIGIAVYPDDGDNAEVIFKRASLAQHQSKEARGNSFTFFNSNMEKAIMNKLLLLEKMREGISKGEFVPFFQPKVDLQTETVNGMEALARWECDGELISPANFIPLAEESGLIIPISKQIYQKAFAETRNLHKQGYALNLAINLSPVQFQDDSFINDLIDLQTESGLATNFIDLEITESILLDNIKDTQKRLEVLSDIGFSVSIDDFGTGYSSLQYLKELPLNTLKIDMSFVAGIGKNKDDEKLIQTIIILSKQFGLKIVAEGIESQTQINFLRAQGCESGQGYFYSKPISGEDFKKWLDSKSNYQYIQ